MRRRSSSRSSRSFTLLGAPGTTALSAIAPTFTILVVRGLVTLKNLSALKPGSHNRSHFALKSFELKLLLSPLFHFLSAKQLESTTTGKQKANVEEEGWRGGLYAFPISLFPERFHPCQPLRRSQSIPRRSFRSRFPLTGTNPLYPDFR